MIKEFKDDDGLTVIVDVEPDEEPQYGIPISVDLRDMFPDWHIEALLRLERLLFESGYRTFQDYKQNKKRAIKDINRLMILIFKADASKIAQTGLSGGKITWG